MIIFVEVKRMVRKPSWPTSRYYHGIRLEELLPNYIEQSLYWEADSHRDGQEIPRRLRNMKVHHRVHNSLPSDPILNQSNPVHTFIFIPLRSNLILPSHLRLGLTSGLFLYLVTKILYTFLLFPCVLHPVLTLVIVVEEYFVSSLPRLETGSYRIQAKREPTWSWGRSDWILGHVKQFWVATRKHWRITPFLSESLKERVNFLKAFSCSV